MNSKNHLHFDHIVIGSGVAGLSNALHLGKAGSTVAVITKKSVDECNTKYAQGGIACVIHDEDSFEDHVSDTIKAGAGLCEKKIVRAIVEAGPEVIRNLIETGARFTTRGELGDRKHQDEFHLGKEGGHTRRRVLHAGDITGEEIERSLIEACAENSNITIFEQHIAVDLITSWRLGWMGENRCLGIYALDVQNNKIKTFSAHTTTVASGGAGKVYMYTSNPDVACGDGLAMCYRANCRIANMEFFQFHPTILFHPKVKSFLISEALRGEGAVLKLGNGRGKFVEFMKKYHEMENLAPRDVVARAIDNEMKMSGQQCVFLDIRGLGENMLKKRFPNIFEKCLDNGINIAENMIPVVPAAHYSCGGVKTDINGATGITGLYAVGETACTGLHGANRLASNSLLEALVIAEKAATDIMKNLKAIKKNGLGGTIPEWNAGDATDSDELVVIAHNWDEIRRFMWDYVGIVRTNKRLERAKARIKNIRKEIEKYYWDFVITPDLIELRNISSVAEIIIDSALARKESRGLHFNADYPEPDPKLEHIDTIIQKPHLG